MSATEIVELSMACAQDAETLNKREMRIRELMKLIHAADDDDVLVLQDELMDFLFDSYLADTE